MLPRCPVTEMSSYRNVSYQNVHYQSVLYRNVWIPVQLAITIFPSTGLPVIIGAKH